MLNINCYESFHFLLVVFWGTVSESNIVRRLLSIYKSIVVLLFLVDVFRQLCSFK